MNTLIFFPLTVNRFAFVVLKGMFPKSRGRCSHSVLPYPASFPATAVAHGGLLHKGEGHSMNGVACCDATKESNSRGKPRMGDQSELTLSMTWVNTR